ncbi:MAG: bifunctional (p)ppGpp synthetase/guanosine-3',5'-bis(diphosphate) 3'-pyrophosphohydrolase [Pseudomonadota bacterium]
MSGVGERGLDYATGLLGRFANSRWATGFSKLLDALRDYLPPEQIELVARAYEFGAAAHHGQKRKSGAPYISHPVAVATILAEMRMDAETIAAAILHDVIEDTSAAADELEAEFGKAVATLVEGVTKLDQVQFKSRAEAQASSFRKMLLAMIEDIRVILVKLADRLHNMRTLESMPAEKQRRIARETLEIYAPIANRLGINTIKVELEELGFRYLYPFRYQVIRNAIRKSAGNQRQMVAQLTETLGAALHSHNIPGEVVGRRKNLYSIYQKMQEKRISLSEIVDVYGFRIIVDSVDTCYRSLGLVHKLYKPMPGRFKDYIAIPRINGYQSLHTTCFGPRGLPLEVQIRTSAMDMLAEDGIASHWEYKATENASSSSQQRAREWLGRLMEMDQSESSEEFMENVKVDLFPDKVYVFTPKGDILRLPRGATPVDFAYAVHTDVGNRCVAAKIDRRLVPLRTPMTNGQSVEIITARGAKPNPNWVNYVVTAKARTAIRQYLKNLRQDEARDLGKRMLNAALAETNLSVRKLSRQTIKTYLDEVGLNTIAELYEQLGLGERLAPLAARQIIAARDGDSAVEVESTDGPLTIAGTEGMVVSYARCCSPIPGDAIMGYLSSGRGIVIHRTQCGNLASFRKHAEKWIDVEWLDGIDERFRVLLTVEAVNRMGVLAEVAATIADVGSNIDQVDVRSKDIDTSNLAFGIEVTDRVHLANVLRSIRGMKSVLRVSRNLA